MTAARRKFTQEFKDELCREVVALLGPHGSGKSTLLGAIAGILPPESGSVTVGGRREAPGLARPRRGERRGRSVAGRKWRRHP